MAPPAASTGATGGCLPTSQPAQPTSKPSRQRSLRDLASPAGTTGRPRFGDRPAIKAARGAGSRADNAAARATAARIAPLIPGTVARLRRHQGLGRLDPAVSSAPLPLDAGDATARRTGHGTAAGPRTG